MSSSDSILPLLAVAGEGGQWGLITGLIFLLIGTVALSSLCSLTEAVLLSLNPAWLKIRADEANSAAGRWLHLKQHVERPISAILIVNTIGNTGLATLAGAQFLKVAGPQWLWAFSIGLTVAAFAFGELLPKIFGVRHATRLAPHLLLPLQGAMWLLHPVVNLFHWITSRLAPSTKSPAEESEASNHIMDIITLTQAAHAEQAIHNREQIIIIHAATLSARRVRNCMVPVEGVKVFRVSLGLKENVRLLGPKLHRSYPVSEDGTLAGVTGVVRAREALAQHLMHEGQMDWHKLARPVLRIRESASLTQLLAMLIEHGEIAALVEDRRGKVAGWITLDDVTQILMGEAPAEERAVTPVAA